MVGLPQLSLWLSQFFLNYYLIAINKSKKNKLATYCFPSTVSMFTKRTCTFSGVFFPKLK